MKLNEEVTKMGGKTYNKKLKKYIYLFIYLFQFYFNRVDPIQDHFWSCSSREPCFSIKIHISTFNKIKFTQ